DKNPHDIGPGRNPGVNGFSRKRRGVPQKALRPRAPALRCTGRLREAGLSSASALRPNGLRSQDQMLQDPAAEALLAIALLAQSLQAEHLPAPSRGCLCDTGLLLGPRWLPRGHAASFWSTLKTSIPTILTRIARSQGSTRAAVTIFGNSFLNRA